MENLKERLEKSNIHLNENFYNFCETYIQSLLQYNKIHNISGAKNKSEVVENIYDSIYPLKFLPKVRTILDIGSGAGFPAMPLAFGLFDCKIYLVESNKKRASFLHLIKSKLNLQNVEVINKRVEEINSLKVDLITSRAVSNIDILFEISKNLITKETKFLFYKGENVKNEINKSFEYEIFNRDKRNYIFIRQLNDN